MTREAKEGYGSNGYARKMKTKDKMEKRHVREEKKVERMHWRKTEEEKLGQMLIFFPFSLFDFLFFFFYFHATNHTNYCSESAKAYKHSHSQLKDKLIRQFLDTFLPPISFLTYLVLGRVLISILPIIWRFYTASEKHGEIEIV